jgi:glycosyltransferase involved in cell wall biosynthesis
MRQKKRSSRSKRLTVSKTKVSVILPSYNSKRTIERCLQALQKQSRQDFEVIVIDSSRDGTAEVVAEKYPEVRLYRFEERKFPGDARNFGISKANGDILAFTDADCIPNQNWISEIVRAHQDPYPTIGGAVDNANPESYVGWAAYFCEFSQWMPHSEERRMIEIPTCCLALKRWAYDCYGPFLEGMYCSDTAFHWRMGREGLYPLFISSIKISHINIDRFGRFLRKEVMHGSHFARVRVREKSLTKLRRTMFALLFLFLPYLLYYRTARRILKNRVYMKEFLISTPLVFLGLVAWSFGEFLGYLFE